MENYSKMHIPEQELTVEVAEIDGVHIDHIDVLEARKRQILQDFTSKTTGSDHKDLRCSLPSNTRLHKFTRVRKTGVEQNWGS